MSKKELPELDTGESTDVLATIQLENVEIDLDVVAKLETTNSSHWIQNLWSNQPHWECLECPFDTLDGESAMAEHYRAQHAPPPPPAPISVVLVADRFGNVMR